jgi:two-component system, LuxR family, response regulator FixJ
LIHINARLQRDTVAGAFQTSELGFGLKGANMTGRRSVAIVDDDAAVLDSIRFILDVAGYPTEGFASAAEFLQANTQHFGCLILDHHMPQMTGLELVERLRADGADVPVMLITGSLSPAIVARAAELGIERVLEKPPGDNFIKANGS